MIKLLVTMLFITLFVLLFMIMHFKREPVISKERSLYLPNNDSLTRVMVICFGSFFRDDKNKG